MKISDQKDWRRQRLAALMDEIGQKALAEKTGVAEAYLFQMSKGDGKHKRNVSDNMVTKIEAKIGRPGWFSIPSQDGDSKEQTQGSKRKKFGKGDADWLPLRTEKQDRLVVLTTSLAPVLDDNQCDHVMSLLNSEAALSKEKANLKKARKELAEAQKKIDSLLNQLEMSRAANAALEPSSLLKAP